MQEENHVFKGMRRDNHPVRQDSEYLWDALNIRITRRDGDSQFSITNERGTSEPLLSISGYYVGHCVVGKYLVVFTNDTKDEDAITSITRIDESLNMKTLYSGPLNISLNHPIETIGVYEIENINKVYWIDGKNQPRVINITKDLLYETDSNNQLYYDGEFDFVQNLKLEEEVSVKKIYGTGIFSPGVIQYAFTYYNKYGQESNIFYTTPIQYITFEERAGAPSERIANAFAITINNLDSNFEYIRAYSIHRTSLDATPTVLRLNDIPLKNAENNSVTFYDYGNSGTVEDPIKLKYIGGIDIVPQCFEHKDGTMFFGDITHDNSRERRIINILSRLNKDNVIDNHDEGGVPIHEEHIDTTKDNYYINNNISKDKGYNAGFKTNETYRLGIQAQLNNGIWTSPAWIDDVVLSSIYPFFVEERTSVNVSQFSSYVNVPDNIINDLKKEGVKKLRLCVVFPKTFERDVICQGIINPTVYNVYDRSKNSPFSQADWFFRSAYNMNDTLVEKTYGGNIEYRADHSLNINGSGYGVEIQSMTLSKNRPKKISDVEHPKDDITDYFIDENIVTFNSPDVEFDTNIWNLNFDNVKLKILGYAELNSIYGDVSLTTSSPTFGKETAGFQKTPIGFHAKSKSYTNGGMVCQPFYNDRTVMYKTFDKVEDGKASGEYYEGAESNFFIYPWQRSGSVNNDQNRGTGEGAQSAILNKKIISNLKIFKPYKPINDLHYSKEPGSPSSSSKNVPVENNILNISKPQIFRDEEVSILKLDVEYLTNSSDITVKSAIYQGNVDTLLTPTKEYGIYALSNDVWFRQGNDYTSKHKSPIRMKYKTTPHMMFRFNPYGDYINQLTLIPRHESIGPLDGVEYPPYFIDGNPEEYVSEGDFMDGKELATLRSIGYEFVNKTPEEPYQTLADVFYNKYVIGRFADELVVGLVKGDQKENIEFPTGNIGYDKSGYIFKIGSETDIIIEETDTISNILKWQLGLNENDFEKSSNIFANGITFDIYRIKKPIWIRVDKESKTIERYTIDNLPEFVGKQNKQEKINSLALDTGRWVSYNQATFGDKDEKIKPYLLIAELIYDRTDEEKEIKFGGSSVQALQMNTWYPASDPISIDNFDTKKLIAKYGDTWYGRYDCLKTYPFTEEDENQIVDIGSFVCETRINLAGRYDRNIGQLSNLYSRPINFNLMNDVYHQHDSFFNYMIYDDDFYKVSRNKNQITWTLEKINGADVDNWTNITLASFINLNGEYGSVTSINSFLDKLVAFQEKAINIVNFNSRVEIPTSDGTAIEITNNYKVDGFTVFNSTIGCNNKWSIVNSLYGLYFLDTTTKNIILFGENMSQLSREKGFEFWSKKYMNHDMWKPDEIKFNGVRSFYDSINNDVYFSLGPSSTLYDDGCLCYSEIVGEFTSFMSYNNVNAMFNFSNGFYSLKNDDGMLKLYRNNSGEYNNFFGEIKPYKLSFISNENALVTKVFDTIEFNSDLYNDERDEPIGDIYTTHIQEGQPFNYIRALNEYQDTFNVLFTPSTLRKKFRRWRGIIPRNKKNSNGRDRIRNNWTKIEIGNDNPKNDKMILHDISVKYTI